VENATDRFLVENKKEGGVAGFADPSPGLGVKGIPDERQESCGREEADNGPTDKDQEEKLPEAAMPGDRVELVLLVLLVLASVRGIDQCLHSSGCGGIVHGTYRVRRLPSVVTHGLRKEPVNNSPCVLVCGVVGNTVRGCRCSQGSCRCDSQNEHEKRSETSKVLHDTFS
jgi:hypothetical protein